jgi:hypothetical protein
MLEAMQERQVTVDFPRADNTANRSNAATAHSAATRVLLIPGSMPHGSRK